MVEQLPTQWGPLCLVVLGLGMRHGLDADHLAAIDGLTRFNARSQPRLARLCGALFALGHGAVVAIVALAVSSLALQGSVPRMLEDAGACIAIAYLLFLGMINLVTVMQASPGQTVRIGGFRGRWLGGLAGANRTWLVALTGALFAISFDTLTQATLFALLGAQFGGWLFALGLSILFMIGMLAVDGMNGLWLSRLLSNRGRDAARASRVMGLAVAGISFTVAFLGISRLSMPALVAWLDGSELSVGLAIILLVAVVYFVSSRCTRRARVQAR